MYKFWNSFCFWFVVGVLIFFTACEKRSNVSNHSLGKDEVFPFLVKMEKCEELELNFYREGAEPVILHFRKKEGGNWVLPDFLGLHVSSGLNSLISDLREIKISRYVSDKEEVAKRNEMGRKQIRFKFADGSISTINIGKKDKTGRVFVQNGETGLIYLAQMSENWSEDPLVWMDKRLFPEIRENKLTRVLLRKKDLEYGLERKDGHFLEENSENLFGDQIHIPKLTAFLRKLAELEFEKPYPKSLWKGEIESEPKYEMVLFLQANSSSKTKHSMNDREEVPDIPLRTDRNLTFSFYSVIGKDQYLLHVEDSDQTSDLYQWMREGVFLYSNFIDVSLDGLFR